VFHVAADHLVYWDTSFFTSFLPKLSSMVTEDEWNKVVGRVSPSSGTLLTRFRVNTRDNYSSVDRAWTAFKRTHDSTATLKQVDKWWSSISQKVEKLIKDCYVAKSREKDSGSASFGNPKVNSKVTGMNFTWLSLMSDACVKQIAENAKTSNVGGMSVDAVMLQAVLLMTSKLLKIYAFDAFDGGREPDESLVMTYVSGSKNSAPLDFYVFPRLFTDISVFKEQVIGSPMYGSSGMLLGLLAMASPPLWENIVKGEVVVKGKPNAMLAAYAGLKPDELVKQWSKA